MPRKSKSDHVVMRNGHPFCLNCGQSYVINLPAPISVAVGAMNGFVKTHANCKKTWTEPEAPVTANTIERMIFWLANGERGTSSETMFSTLAKSIHGAPQLTLARWGEHHPSDPDDFSRCHKLLETVPELRAKLPLMKAVSPVWSALVDNWEKLTEMHNEQVSTGKRNGMYEFMKELGC